MTEQREHPRLYSHITKSSFLHVEDALEIGKLRIFAGHYKKGNGSNQMTAHWLDVTDARVLFNDMAWGKLINYVEFKGTGRGESAVSRVLKVTSKDDKVWIRLETGPGQVIGQGAVKPKGEPTTVINVPFSVWDARKLAAAVLSYLQAYQTAALLSRQPAPATDDFDGFFRGEVTPRQTPPEPESAEKTGRATRTVVEPPKKPTKNGLAKLFTEVNVRLAANTLEPYANTDDMVAVLKVIGYGSYNKESHATMVSQLIAQKEPNGKSHPAPGGDT